ncbi:MAG: hypothetical protein KAJ19_24615, partial [Gammaproteobacteria bacterium]|nr:hypothetical protein [Gammaproteobacteria bacterium]
YELHENAGGDLIWSSCPFWGIPWVEAALGCRVIADHQTGSTRSEPPADFAKNPAIPEFSMDNVWVAKMLEFIPALVNRSGGRYPVGATLMRGISDLLSALYGSEQFILAMFEKPDDVRDVAHQLTDFWISFGRCLLEHLPDFHGGSGSFFYSMWFEKKTIWTQEDASALLSPDLYEQFIHPCVCRISEAFDNTVIHLHPSKFMPIDYLLSSKIGVIELHIDKGGPTAEQLYETHVKVLSQKPLIIWGDLSEKDLGFILKSLPCKGLAVNMAVSSQAQAESMWELACKLWSSRQQS